MARPVPRRGGRCHAAWLLVQDADRDPAFQRSCLGLITEAARHGEATPAELAYLTDRVLLAEGQPQEYGTQMAGRDGRWQPRQLREPGTVDQRGVTCPGCGWATTVWVGDSAEPPGAARW